MSVRISLTLEASEMFLSLHMIFSLERAAVVRAILERISGFDPSLEMTAPRYLKFSTSSSLWPFILISLWKPFGLFVITFVLSGPISIMYLVVVLLRRSIRTPASSSSSAFTIMSSAKRKLVMSRPPMLTLPSWSSKASHMIFSRKMLKRFGESRHPCRTPTVVLRGARWLSGRVSDSGARGPGFETYLRRVVSWARHFIPPRKYWLITQEAMAPSRHDWKIVDWDVKPQHNQPTVVLNHSPVLPLNRTALWALSYRFSMARMMLALMLYFLIVAQECFFLPFLVALRMR